MNPSAAKKVGDYAQKFRKNWTSDDRFKGWLKPVVGDETMAMCIVCKTTMKAHLSSIVGHSIGKKHCELLKTMVPTASITELLQPRRPDPQHLMELKLAVYVTEHATTSAVDHLGELVSSLDSSSATLKGISLHRTKCSRLQKHVLAPAMMKELREDLGDSNYSLILDESTNTSNLQCLGLVIRYYSRTQRCTVDTMYRLVHIESATAQSVYEKVLACVGEDNIPLDKLIGIGCDGANAMVGRNHSVSTLLKEKIPNLVVFRCVCHSLHLAASKAVELLPVALEFLVRECHNWFSCSPKRSLTYKQLFDILDEKTPNRIPGHSATRWLARFEAVTVILDQWETLHLHFQLACQSERCYTAKQLSEMLSDKQNKLYLLCMKHILKEVTRVNKLFQSQHADVTKLLDDLLLMFATLMQIVVIPAELSKCSLYDMPIFPFRNYLMPVRCIHLGFEFEQATAGIPNDVVIGVRDRCKDFIIELISQVQERLPENLKILFMINNLSASIALSQSKPSITPLALHFKHVVNDISSIEVEWNSLQFVKFPENCLGSVVEFWTAVSLLTDAENKQRFGNISQLALSLFSLPFSNATVERLFSLMNIVHSKLCNRLHVSSVESILQIRYRLKRTGETCVSFQPTPYMLQHFFDKSKQNDNDEECLIAIDD